MPKWVYKILTADTMLNLEKMINEAAEYGWEAINITSEGAFGGHPRLSHCLVRTLRSQAPQID